MEEVKSKAIILNAHDHGENDKLVSVFSLDFGKISVKFTGVKKPKAKLKPLTQPFSFVELEMIKKGDFFSCKTGLVITSFPRVLADYKRTMCAYIITEILLKILPKNKDESELFALSVKSLSDLENSDPYLTTLKFILGYFDIMGEGLNLDLNGNHIYLDLMLGNFSSERSQYSIEVDHRCYENLLKTITLDDATNNENKTHDEINIKCIKLLNNIFRAKYDVELSSCSFI